IRHVRFGRSLTGYRRASVDHALAEIADSYEAVWQERMDLSDRVEDLEREIARHRDVEELLRTTLLTAERASQDMRDDARRGAGGAETGGRQGEAWSVRGAAAPCRGSGTDARAKRLAGRLRLGPGALAVGAGRSGRDKVVELRGLGADGAARRLDGAA